MAQNLFHAFIQAGSVRGADLFSDTSCSDGAPSVWAICMAYASSPDPDNIARKSTNPPPPPQSFCLILRGTWFDIGVEDGINEHEGPLPVMDSETEASIDARTACSTSSRWGAASTVDEETAACRAFRASLTAVWILESSLSRSWSIRAGSAPPLKGLGCWCPGGGPVVAWSGRLAVPLMPWPGSFSSLGVSLASAQKASQEELNTVIMK